MPTPTRSASDPDPAAVRVMAIVDRMKPGMKALVHEYGFTVVNGMIADGYRDPDALRPELESWRERRQV